MDNQTLSILAIFLASVLSATLAFLASMWVNKRKIPVDIKKEETEIKLNEGGLAEKYHSLANLQAGENIELTNQNMELKNQLEKQNIEHKKEIEGLRADLLKLDQKHLDKEKELEAKIDEEILKREAETKLRLAAEDYIRRLLYQFKSWDITPVPINIEDYKAEILKDRKCIDGNNLIA
jgi:hypothetical protein